MSAIVTFFKSIDVAFSMYSKIPMPRFNWDSKDMKYALIFFPWVGAVIGGLLLGWKYLAAFLGAGEICFTAVAMAIPLLVTGGFHVDGYMDTMDGIHSYQSREKKLEILKDPHIGAFSVISLLVYSLLYLGFFSTFAGKSSEGFYVVCCMFWVTRCLSGISVVSFKSAKNDGMLQTESKNSGKRSVRIGLIVELILAYGLMLAIWPVCGAVAIVASLLTFGYYRWASYRHFGGTTGDLAGFFVTLCELVMVMSVSITSLIAPA